MKCGKACHAAADAQLVDECPVGPPVAPGLAGDHQPRLRHRVKRPRERPEQDVDALVGPDRAEAEHHRRPVRQAEPGARRCAVLRSAGGRRPDAGPHQARPLRRHAQHLDRLPPAVLRVQDAGVRQPAERPQRGDEDGRVRVRGRVVDGEHHAHAAPLRRREHGPEDRHQRHAPMLGVHDVRPHAHPLRQPAAGVVPRQRAPHGQPRPPWAAAPSHPSSPRRGRGSADTWPGRR